MSEKSTVGEFDAGEAIRKVQEESERKVEDDASRSNDEKERVEDGFKNGEDRTQAAGTSIEHENAVRNETSSRRIEPTVKPEIEQDANLGNDEKEEQHDPPGNHKTVDRDQKNVDEKNTPQQKASGNKKKKTKTKKPPPPPAEEVLRYRANVDQLNAHFPNFQNIATSETRHNWTRSSDWSPRIVVYDRVESSVGQKTVRHEPWKGHPTTPYYQDFSRTLKKVPEDCIQRIILVEDLTPLLIDLFGATFQIPPHVFEEHLDRSGYRRGEETSNRAAAWHTRSSAQGYASVTWYRPVRPLILRSGFRSKLINSQTTTLPCPYEGCRNHRLDLSTLANIWRRNIKLSPEPKGHQIEKDYPVGWEERATVWTREFENCKFGMIAPLNSDYFC